MADRIAVWGTGSLGTVFGAHLARAGLDVTLVDSWREHIDALNQNGARVEGTRSFTVPVTARVPEEVTGQFDVVFFMVKQTAIAQAYSQMRPHLTGETVVCVMQNGIPEQTLRELPGCDCRFAGAPVGWGATLTAPGVSRLTSDEESIHFTLGTDDPGVSLPRLKSYLETMCPVVLTDNLAGVRWSKLLMNSTFSGLSTALGCTFGDILDHDETMRLVVHVATEGTRVAKAAGVRLVPMGGNDYEGELFCRGSEDLPRVIGRYREIWASQKLLKASMLQDLEKGRPCEVDYINGVLVSEGKRHSIPTPVNAKVVELICESVRSGTMPEFDRNLEMLKREACLFE